MKYLTLVLPLLLTACAVGSLTSAVSGVSYHAHSADTLSAEGEQRIVNRILSERVPIYD